MQEKNNTIGGKPITPELIGELSAVFERDWTPAEATIVPTEYGKALHALQELDLPAQQIEALERRAKSEHKSFSFYLRSVLQNELVG
jgi:hypothetical protein